MSATGELALLVLVLLIIAVLVADLLRDRRRSQELLSPEKRDRNRELDSASDGPPPRRSRVEQRLRAAGLQLDAATWITAQVLLSAGVLLVGLELFPGALLAVVATAGFVAYLPDALVRAWGSRRARRFEARLVDAVDFMVSALHGGENATQAMVSAAAAAEEPVKTELREVVHRLGLGMPLDRALGRIVEGYDSEGSRIFTQALQAKLEAGGNLAPVLKAVNQILRERLKLRMKLKSQLSGAQFSAIVIALLPYTLIPIYLWRKPDWVERLWHHPLGPQLLFFACLLQIFGFLWLRRILKMEL
jgi:tight adherence protein B